MSTQGDFIPTSQSTVVIQYIHTNTAVFVV